MVIIWAPFACHADFPHRPRVDSTFSSRRSDRLLSGHARGLGEGATDQGQGTRPAGCRVSPPRRACGYCDREWGGKAATAAAFVEPPALRVAASPVRPGVPFGRL